MAKRKKRKPKRPAAPRPPQEPQAIPRQAPVNVLGRLAAVLIAATFSGSLLAYFIPPPAKRRMPQASLWSQTHAPRLWRTAALWGRTRDWKRATGPLSMMGGDVARFTQLWAAVLDERLMPQTKCWDHTREQHIRYLLPNTGRRPINPPPGPDTRPPVIVGYGLRPDQLRPGPIPFCPQMEHSKTLTLDEDHSLGQSFMTFLDYDLIRAVALLAPLDAELPSGRYTTVLYHRLDKRRVLARTTGASLHEEEGMQVLVLAFVPPVRLSYNRGSTPYLLEVTWTRPDGYTGPAPAFFAVDRDAYAGGELYVDGARRPGSDLAFSVVATHTDVAGYTLVLSPGEPRPGEEWPPFFVAVRDDVLRLVGPGVPGESTADFSKRLNKVLLEL